VGARTGNVPSKESYNKTFFHLLKGKGDFGLGGKGTESSMSREDDSLSN